MNLRPERYFMRLRCGSSLPHICTNGPPSGHMRHIARGDPMRLVLVPYMRGSKGNNPSKPFLSWCVSNSRIIYFYLSYLDLSNDYLYILISYTKNKFSLVIITSSGNCSKLNLFYFVWLFMQKRFVSPYGSQISQAIGRKIKCKLISLGKLC